MTTTRMKRKPRYRILPLFPTLSRTLCLASCLTGILPAQGTEQKGEPHAIVAGTVFRDPGFAQPGASVVLTLKIAPAKKLQEQISSPRGEFSFRVPAGPQTYLVTATLKGFQIARQEIKIQDQEQNNATLLLVPESKKKR